MRRSICVMIYCLLSIAAYCQVVAIQNDNGDKLCLGFDNYLKVAVEETSSASVFLTTDNGRIRGEKGYYNVEPLRMGTAVIRVFKKTKRGEKIIDSAYFRVKRAEVSFTLFGQKEGKIAQEYLCTAIAPAIIIENMPIDAKFPIDSMTVIVKRENKIIFMRELHSIKGTRFDKITRDFFKTLKDQDELVLTNVFYRDRDSAEIKLPELNFIITPANYTESDIITDPITGTEISKKELEKSEEQSEY